MANQHEYLLTDEAIDRLLQIAVRDLAEAVHEARRLGIKTNEDTLELLRQARHYA